MSKRHFIALADTIRDHNRYNAVKFTDDQINSLARFCKSQNSAFDWGRWTSYIAGMCGPNGGEIKKAS